MSTKPAWPVLQLALLAALYETDTGKPVPMPRPTKHVDERTSTVLRALHPPADVGPLRAAVDDIRWPIVLFDTGRVLPHFAT